MSREGRSQPIQPIVGQHGFLGNTPANGVLPPYTVFVVENQDDRRRKTLLLQPVSSNGLYSTVTPPSFVAPPPIVNVDQPVRVRALTAPPAYATHGVDTTPIVLPPAPVFSILTDRTRPTVPPVVIRGSILAGTTKDVAAGQFNGLSTFSGTVTKIGAVQVPTFNGSSIFSAAVTRMPVIQPGQINGSSTFTATLNKTGNVTAGSFQGSSTFAATISGVATNTVSSNPFLTLDRRRRRD